MQNLLSNKKTVIGVMVLVFSVSLIWSWNSRYRFSKPIQTNPVLRRDFDLLRRESNSTPVPSIAVALQRLNSYRAPEGRTEALKRVSDSRSEVRAAVAESLSMIPMEGEVKESFLKLSQDSDETVRIAAHTAISRSRDSGRVQILEDALSRSVNSPKERLVIHAGLYQAKLQASPKDAPAAEGHLKEVMADFKKGKTDSSFYAFGIRTLIRLSLTDSESVSVLENAFQDPKLPKEVQPYLYRYLVKQRPDFISKRYLQDVRSTIPGLRMAAMNSLMEICPPDRWKALRYVLTDASVEFQSKSLARSVVGYLGGSVGPKGVIQEPATGTDRCSKRKSK